MEVKSQLVKKILESMDVSPAKLKEILNPSQDEFDADLLKRFESFIKTSDKVMICGDYDFDGISSTVIACLVCEAYGVEYGYYIPDRINEGYGTQASTLQQAYDKGYRSVLMVDNGVKAYEALEFAASKGMRVCIVDHHGFDVVPKCDLFIHPEVLAPYYADMSAGGLMAVLAQELNVSNTMIKVLGGTSTIADVMPLVNKNRSLVIEAIDLLNTNELPHFDKLVKRSRYTVYSSTFIAFQMVPKINSIGRLSDKANVNTAVRFFLHEDLNVIDTYVKQILELNDLRKNLSKKLKEIALSQVSDSKVQIISDARFHEGLLGIIANQIMQDTQKPTIVLKPYDSYSKGSARSNSLSLHDLFSKVEGSYFEALGGHDFAYGMTLSNSDTSEFEVAVNEVASKMESNISIDMALEIPMDWLREEAISELKALEPFGEGFVLPKVRVKLPEYNLGVIRGYGYKFSFKHPVLKEAVYFTQDKLDFDTMYSYIEGTLDISSPYKTTMFIESIEK